MCILVEWSKEWQMLFNVDKCRVIHMGYNNKLAEYHMNDVKLECVSEEKDLDVYQMKKICELGLLLMKI